MNATGGTAVRPVTRQLASAASAEALRAWLNGARCGHQVVYASGPELPRETDGVRLVTKWKDEGLVITHQRRDPGDPDRWQFLITKTARAVDPSASLAPVGGGDDPLPCRAVDRGDLSKLLALLRQCAERRMPCPSNAVIANAIGLGRGKAAANRAQYLMHRLATERQVAVESRGRCLPRVVTILATGRACGKATARG